MDENHSALTLLTLSLSLLFSLLAFFILSHHSHSFHSFRQQVNSTGDDPVTSETIEECCNSLQFQHSLDSFLYDEVTFFDLHCLLKRLKF